MSRKRSKRAFWWFMAALCFVPLVAVLWQARAAQAAVDREVAALKKLGVPTNAAEMRRIATVPDEENAAPLYRQAFESLKAVGSTMPNSSGPADPAIEARLAQWVSDHGPTLALAEQASRLPACDFDREWEKGVHLTFPEFSHMKDLVKLASTRARSAADHGQFEESARWLTVGAAIAAHANEPTLIGMLVSIAGEAIVNAEFQRQIDAFGGQPAFRKAARQFLDRAGPLPDFSRALRGEVFGDREILKQIRDGEVSTDVFGSGGTATDLMLASLRLRVMNARVEAKILRRLRGAIEHMARDGSTAGQIAAGSKLDRDFGDDNSLTGKIAQHFASVFAQASSVVAKVEASRRQSEAGLALWTLRSETGSFPATLPAEPWSLDPYTGKPFVYTPGKASFKLYSVGPNGVDDGGARTAAGARTDDVQFNLRGSKP